MPVRNGGRNRAATSDVIPCWWNRSSNRTRRPPVPPGLVVSGIMGYTGSEPRAPTVNRTEFQQLAEVRIKEAEALLAAGLWDGAYYLAGYAVECGLNACIANLFKAETFP